MRRKMPTMTLAELHQASEDRRAVCWCDREGNHVKPAIIVLNMPASYVYDLMIYHDLRLYVSHHRPRPNSSR